MYLHLNPNITSSWNIQANKWVQFVFWQKPTNPLYTWSPQEANYWKRKKYAKSKFKITPKYSKTNPSNWRPKNFELPKTNCLSWPRLIKGVHLELKPFCPTKKQNNQSVGRLDLIREARKRKMFPEEFAVKMNGFWKRLDLVEIVFWVNVEKVKEGSEL